MRGPIPTGRATGALYLEGVSKCAAVGQRRKRSLSMKKGRAAVSTLALSCFEVDYTLRGCRGSAVASQCFRYARGYRAGFSLRCQSQVVIAVVVFNLLVVARDEIRRGGR
jgi:hypothetical protein